MPWIAFVVAMLAVVVFLIEWARTRSLLALGLMLFVLAFVLTFVVRTPHGVAWSW